MGSKLGRSLARTLLRVLFVMPRRLAQPAQAGFILPTVVLLLLVVSLTVGSITLRTFTRTTQAIGDRQQQVIYNAATPAIDRAKAKLEYLFSQDDRMPSGTPGENFLMGMMANDNQPRGGPAVAQKTEALTSGVLANPYDFERETPIELDGNPATRDNAWQFPVDSDGDGTDDTVIAYSIVFQTPADLNELSKQLPAEIEARANVLEVKNGPLSSTAAASTGCSSVGASAVGDGWFTSGGSDPSKNFQVNAIAIPGTLNANGTLNTANALATIATLEFQQDRKIEPGNKWGAWFRNDLEITPGVEFRWNGAMHTEGNLIIGEGRNKVDPFRAFLISSTDSCLNTAASDSEITIGEPPVNENGGVNFQAQVISGSVAAQTYDQTSLVHVFGNADPGANPPQLAPGSDSLAGNANAAQVADLALDPIRLLTEGISVNRSGQPNRAPAWTTPDDTPEIEARITNQSQDQPLVGDSYRADNRQGPQPRYSNDITIGAVGIPAGNPDLVNDGLPGDSDAGLDGYWERRARNEGMRVVVGQRLQLGDPYGWTGTDESLYPFDQCVPTNNLGCHENRQRRSLSDYLAAVQSTAIYHAAVGANDDDLPQVCLATTVHPGTAATLKNSSTFEALQIQPDPLVPTPQTTILTDFFTGRGTNGWEFDFPYPTANLFDNAIGPAAPLGIALRNLAQFAGDPLGGAPSFPPTQDGNVHPYPLMSMWGDYSKLRLVLASLDGGTTTYDLLSPADKTTLHTAACTMGMLAYNINYLNRFDPTAAGNTVYGSSGSDEISRLSMRLDDIATNAGLPGGVDPQSTPNEPAENFIASLEQWNQIDPTTVTNTMLAIARVLANKEQVRRDRLLGFRNANTAIIPPNYSCGLTGDLEKLCPDATIPKYPILHLLFPPGNVVGIPESDGETRDLVTLDAYITAENGDTYKPTLGGIPSTSPFLDNLPTSQLVMFPRESPRTGWETPIAATAFASAPLASDPSVNPNSNERSLIRCVDEACGAGSIGVETWQVPFKDAALYDGRERMGVRALDIDLDMLRRANFPGGERWLPLSGIVFAFREDAVREDAIVRPATAGAAACNDFTAFNSSPTCQTLADGNALTDSTDPQLLTGNFSMKAVDFIGDPGRRPHGFRLINGETLKRVGDGGIGMSFISDNSAYIRGDFNLHQTGGTVLQEFLTPLTPDWNNFYTRNTIDQRFSAPTVDDWRPTEVLADAVTILSSNFCDGAIEDGFETAGTLNASVSINAALGDDTTALYGCTVSAGDPWTSYVNQRRPRNGRTWKRQLDGDDDTPIVIDRNGAPLDDGDAPYGDGYITDRNNSLITAVPQTVNLALISGIVPSRVDQPYGGLQNFPRFLEDWGDVPLSMSGTFYQLNFSTAATAPYDQEVWEPGDDPTTAVDRYPYYDPPERLWGYDVGLQYVRPAPIASRFATQTPARSEFYSEPTLDDPYIAQLCRQVAGANSFCPAP